MRSVLFALLITSSITVASPAGATGAPTNFCPARSQGPGIKLTLPLTSKVEALSRELVDNGFAPGVVVMIEQRGKIVVDMAHGYSDIAAKTPMTRDSLFRIYSMTKPVTSMAALSLVHSGKLRLDDPVSKYIPEMADVKVWDGSDNPVQTKALLRPMRVSDLLTHTAGFGYRGDDKHPVLKQYAQRGVPAGPGVDAAPTDGSAPVASTADLAVRLSTIPLLNQPGTKFTYGNATDVLGRVVEVAGGQRLSEVIQARILTPLKMRSTGFELSATASNQLTSAYLAKSQAPSDAGVFDVPDVVGLKATPLFPIDPAARSIFLKRHPVDFGGAGLVATASDYLKFTQALRQEGKLRGTTVLPKPLTRLMMTDQLPPEARTDSRLLGRLTFGYGLSVQAGPTSKDVPLPECGAFWGGAASTFFWVDPKNEISGVVMTQVFGGDVKSYWLEMMRFIYKP